MKWIKVQPMLFNIRINNNNNIVTKLYFNKLYNIIIYISETVFKRNDAL